MQDEPAESVDFSLVHQALQDAARRLLDPHRHEIKRRPAGKLFYLLSFREVPQLRAWQLLRDPEPMQDC
ncbi:MAG TPA: hypothetical protein VFD71_20365 [Planctomycetota bacterium]|nr:hypothetical protein [Planctomycetota bacterium]